MALLSLPILQGLEHSCVVITKMPRFGIRALFFGSYHESHHPQHLHDPISNHGRSLAAPPSPSYYLGRSSSVTCSPSRQTFSATMMDENIVLTESIIKRWDPSTNLEARMTSLFRSDKREAGLLLRAVADLQRAMLFFSSDELAGDPAVRSRALVRAQALMQAAIRRLELELELLLSSSPDPLESISARTSSSSGNDELSDEEKISSASDAVPAANDLRAISEAMIAAGYGKEYVRIYKTHRKSIVDEGLYRLGFERLSSSQIQKLDWDILELKIKSWLRATGPAIQTLFSGELTLAEHVFSGSNSILESCFADITRDAATALLSFPDSIAKTKSTPEKLFRILDLYDTISTLLPSIKSLFSLESTTSVLSQTLTSLQKLEETANSLLADFEALIQKDASRSAVSGGGVHPLTRYVINYLVFLGDYKLPLANILANSNPSSPQDPGLEESSLSSPMAKRISWLVFVLLCKLDGKAEAYKHVGQSYLFLANNLHYIVNKINESELKEILGDEWLQRRSAKVRHYMGNYERLVWATVAAAIPAVGVATAAEAGESMKAFNAAFEEASRNQGEWVVVDKTARDEVRASAVRMVVPAYRGFYWRCRELLGGSAGSAVVRYSPEDVRNRIEELVSISPGSSPSLGSGSGSGLGSGSGSSWASGSGSKLSFCWRSDRK
ncbi:Exocyst complex component Exo70 protein [Dioscorea alata]|uniref:Exocyst complex component Exo70 protein n=1 Tax=Dioscorea alata TaxID=55571 RepID=A0ACB7U976_DIOAL|nr:Exocyst complex component Exo70 protein [Dioscorea alata]